jgi:hypothetical protein
MSMAIVPTGECCNCSVKQAELVVETRGQQREFCIDCAAQQISTFGNNCRVVGLTDTGREYIDHMIKQDWFLYGLLTEWLRR